MAEKWKKVTVWKATREDDSDVYSIRTRTKRECQKERAENHQPVEKYGATFKPCKKIVIPYRDTFELISTVCGEGGCRAWEITEKEFKDGDF